MGPLQGIKIIEIAGMGPGPYGAMMLADMGAEVIRVERPGGGLFSGGNARLDFLNRGKQCICVNLKSPEGLETVLRLIEQADGLVEGFRPGVMEKLGLSPEVCQQRNPRLVYGRMTGWGQDGPLAQTAGHDINYISIAGALHPIGRTGEKPAIPLNLVGDFGGGGLFLAYGMVCALLEARQSGRGQVVDAAMVDGAASLMSSVFGAYQANFWSPERGSNMLDSGSHFYEVYETADQQYVAVGAIESQFYASLLAVLGEAAAELPDQMDAARWPEAKEKLAAIFKSHDRQYWCDKFEGTDACFSPVLSLEEVRSHPHNRERATFIEADDGIWQPAPAPRFSRTPAPEPMPASDLGADSRQVLEQFGFTESEIEQCYASGAVA